MITHRSVPKKKGEKFQKKKKEIGIILFALPIWRRGLIEIELSNRCILNRLRPQGKTVRGK